VRALLLLVGFFCLKQSNQGTLLWMAPEVVAGRKYGLPADVYSFSMVCVEIATHQPPW
jgi:serine/threonine protein kinase